MHFLANKFPRFTEVRRSDCDGKNRMESLAIKTQRNAFTLQPSTQSEPTKTTRICLCTGSYMAYLFLWREGATCPTLECLICREKLSPVLSKLKIRL